MTVTQNSFNRWFDVDCILFHSLPIWQFLLIYILTYILSVFSSFCQSSCCLTGGWEARFYLKASYQFNFLSTSRNPSFVYFGFFKLNSCRKILICNLFNILIEFSNDRTFCFKRCGASIAVYCDGITHVLIAFVSFLRKTYISKYENY